MSSSAAELAARADARQSATAKKPNPGVHSVEGEGEVSLVKQDNPKKRKRFSKQKGERTGGGGRGGVQPCRRGKGGGGQGARGGLWARTGALHRQHDGGGGAAVNGMEAKGLTSGGGDQAASGDVHHELVGLQEVHTKNGEADFCLEETPGEIAAREANEST